MKVLITGATGLVGQRLGQTLVAAGHSLVVVSRSKARALQTLSFPADIIEGDLSLRKLSNLDALAPIEAVVHLMGETVADVPWTQDKKIRLENSRVLASKNLSVSLREAGIRPKVFVGASAIGFYGDGGEQEMKAESSPKGMGYLAELTDQWEKAMDQVDADRRVKIRIGVVLSERGGMIAKISSLFKWGLGGRLGSGQQWMSWIHLDDLVGLFSRALEDSTLAGTLNGVSPNPVRNSVFTRTFCSKLMRPQGPAAPAFAIRAILGESSSILLNSQKVVAPSLPFMYPNIDEALDKIASKIRGHQFFFAEQFFKLAPDKLFPFFADAKNLEKITPPSLRFSIISPGPLIMTPGSRISYKLSLHGIPIRWTTQIVSWKPNENFEDLQESGPYELWRHSHDFQDLGSGTLMTDRVCYRVPFGILGDAIAGYFVRREIERIFAYRREVCAKIFCES